jgi:hypothetical protein
MPEPLPHNTLYKIIDLIYPLAFYTTSYSEAYKLQLCGHIVEPAGVPVQPILQSDSHPVTQPVSEPVAPPISQPSSRHFCQPVFRDHQQPISQPVSRTQQQSERSSSGHNFHLQPCSCCMPEINIKISGQSRKN